LLADGTSTFALGKAIATSADASIINVRAGTVTTADLIGSNASNSR
jgi:hypothetical protein